VKQILIGWLVILSFALTAAGADINEALSFHAGFDRSLDADFARGGRAATKLETGMEIVDNGHIGRCVRVAALKNGVRAGAVVYPAEKNLDMRAGTVSIWFKVDEAAVKNKDINKTFQFIFLPFLGSSRFYLGVGPADEGAFRLYCEAENGQGTYRSKSARCGDYQDWHQAVVTWKQGDSGHDEVSLYLDGTAAGKPGADWTLPRGAPEVKLGRETVSGAFTGFLDEFRIFDRALKAEEVKILYESGS